MGISKLQIRSTLKTGKVSGKSSLNDYSANKIATNLKKYCTCNFFFKDYSLFASPSISFSLPQCGQNKFFLGWNSSLDANDHQSLQKSQVKCHIVSLVNFIYNSFTLLLVVLYIIFTSQNFFKNTRSLDLATKNSWDQ